MVREQTAVSFYNKLRESASKSSSTPLLIFPSTSDVDSLCALKIIFHILKSDGFQYACYPVSSFNEIHNYAGATLTSAAETGDYVSMLLINWGCHRDLQKTLNMPPSARVFVVDSHRPIHLNNISQENESVVVLFTNEDEKIVDLVYSFDITLAELANASYMCRDGNELEESEEDSDESDEEDSENSDNDEDDEQGSRRKRRRVSDSDLVQLFKNQVKKYYKLGTFHGKPSGCLMYELADSLRKNTNEVLWLSLTDQFVHERLSDERYRDSVAELEDRIRCAGNLDVVTSVTLKDGTKIRAPHSCKIACEDELRLMLLKEWSLFDSMLCSSYIATKLKTWSDNGVKKLNLLLARMGFALVDCQQKFQYMSMEVKKKIKHELSGFCQSMDSLISIIGVS